MKKRKELNALVANGKARCAAAKKLATTATGASSGANSSQELLDDGDPSETSDTEDASVALRARKSLNGRKASRLYVACMPLCMLTLMTASVVGSAMLIWMHLGLRQEVDMLRNYLRKVESGTRKTPEEFHTIHTRLSLLEGNSSANRESILKISDNVDELSREIANLKKTTDSLSKSIAAEPQIVTLPQTVQSLEQSVASLGSQITSLDTMVKEMKKQTSSFNKEIQTSVDGLQKRMEILSNESHSSSIQTPGQIQLLTEGLQHMEFTIDDLNKTMIMNSQVIFEDLHHNQEKIRALNNQSNYLGNQFDSMLGRVSNIEEIPVQVNKIIEEKVNESIENVINPKTNETFQNMTAREMLLYLDSLPRLYHELLIKFPEYKNLTFQNVTKNVVNGLPENSSYEYFVSEHEQQAEKIKNVSLQIEKIQKDFSSLWKEQSATKAQMEELQSRLLTGIETPVSTHQESVLSTTSSVNSTSSTV